MLVENINEWIFDSPYLVVIYVVDKKVKEKKVINFHYIRLIERLPKCKHGFIESS